MKGAAVKDKNLKAIELFCAGISTKEIARSQNRKTAEVTAALKRALARGDIPKEHINKFNKELDIIQLKQKYGINLGCVSKMIEARMSASAKEWLFRQAIENECESLSEYIVEVLLEEYYS